MIDQESELLFANNISSDQINLLINLIIHKSIAFDKNKSTFSAKELSQLVYLIDTLTVVTRHHQVIANHLNSTIILKKLLIILDLLSNISIKRQFNNSNLLVKNEHYQLKVLEAKIILVFGNILLINQDLFEDFNLLNLKSTNLKNIDLDYFEIFNDYQESFEADKILLNLTLLMKQFSLSNSIKNDELNFKYLISPTRLFFLLFYSKNNKYFEKIKNFKEILYKIINLTLSNIKNLIWCFFKFDKFNLNEELLVELIKLLYVLIHNYKKYIDFNDLNPLVPKESNINDNKNQIIEIYTKELNLKNSIINSNDLYIIILFLAKLLSLDEKLSIKKSINTVFKQPLEENQWSTKVNISISLYRNFGNFLLSLPFEFYSNFFLKSHNFDNDNNPMKTLFDYYSIKPIKIFEIIMVGYFGIVVFEIKNSNLIGTDNSNVQVINDDNERNVLKERKKFKSSLKSFKKSTLKTIKNHTLVNDKYTRFNKIEEKKFNNDKKTIIEKIVNINNDHFLFFLTFINFFLKFKNYLKKNNILLKKQIQSNIGGNNKIQFNNCFDYIQKLTLINEIADSFEKLLLPVENLNNDDLNLLIFKKIQPLNEIQKLNSINSKIIKSEKIISNIKIKHDDLESNEDDDEEDFNKLLKSQKKGKVTSSLRKSKSMGILKKNFTKNDNETERRKSEHQVNEIEKNDNILRNKKQFKELLLILSCYSSIKQHQRSQSFDNQFLQIDFNDKDVNCQSLIIEKTNIYKSLMKCCKNPFVNTNIKLLIIEIYFNLITENLDDEFDNEDFLNDFLNERGINQKLYKNFNGYSSPEINSIKKIKINTNLNQSKEELLINEFFSQFENLKNLQKFLIIFLTNKLFYLIFIFLKNLNQKNLVQINELELQKISNFLQSNQNSTNFFLPNNQDSLPPTPSTKLRGMSIVSNFNIGKENQNQLNLINTSPKKIIQTIDLEIYQVSDDESDCITGNAEPPPHKRSIVNKTKSFLSLRNNSLGGSRVIDQNIPSLPKEEKLFNDEFSFEKTSKKRENLDNIGPTDLSPLKRNSTSSFGTLEKLEEADKIFTIIEKLSKY